MEAKIGVMWPQAQDTQEFLKPPEAGRNKEKFYSIASRGNVDLRTPSKL